MAEESIKLSLASFSLVLSTGKTSSAAHRATLLSILSILPSSTTTSTSLVSLALPLIAKESSELAYFSIMDLLEKHLPLANVGESELKLLSKALGEVKVKLRRKCWSTIGEVFWNFLRSDDGDESKKVRGTLLAEALVVQLESALKNVAGNPLAAPAGSLEGMVAVAVLVGGSGKWTSSNLGSYFPFMICRRERPDLSVCCWC